VSGFRHGGRDCEIGAVRRASGPGYAGADLPPFLPGGVLARVCDEHGGKGDVPSQPTMALRAPQIPVDARGHAPGPPPPACSVLLAPPGAPSDPTTGSKLPSGRASASASRTHAYPARFQIELARMPPEPGSEEAGGRAALSLLARTRKSSPDAFGAAIPGDGALGDGDGCTAGAAPAEPSAPRRGS